MAGVPNSHAVHLVLNVVQHALHVTKNGTRSAA